MPKKTPRGVKFCSGYRHLNHSNGTEECKPIDSRAWEAAFLTGRPHIDDEIVRCFSKALRIPLSPTHGDIDSYLEMRLNDDTDPHAMNNELRADIRRIVPEKISER